jgi:hypothetical protein
MSITGRPIELVSIRPPLRDLHPRAKIQPKILALKEVALLIWYVLYYLVNAIVVVLLNFGYSCPCIPINLEAFTT